MDRLRQSSRRFNAHYEHVPSDETDLAISFINNQNFGWKADTCKLQKHHAEYGTHCDKPVTLAQTDNNDKEKAKSKFGDGSEKFKKAYTKAQSWAKKYKTAADIPDSEVPESYTLADIDGFDFTGEVRD